MALGALQSAFAYEVSPRQTADFRGGAVRKSADFEAKLADTYVKSGLEQASWVNFVVDPAPGARTNPVRMALIDIGFAVQPKKTAAALKLAEQLGAATDHRSKPALLVISIHEVPRHAAHRQMIIWSFPQQEVFVLRSHSKDAEIDVQDVFSRESKLRKAAMFTGGSGRTDLLTGRALDLQSTERDKTAADLWIVKFLEARLQMTSDEGTRVLAAALQKTHDRFAGEPGAQAEIQAAIVRLRNSQDARVSVNSVAGQLSEPVAAALRATQRNRDGLTAQFALDKPLFDELVRYRIYALDNGVWVSAPFEVLGRDVTEEATNEGKRIVATGIVETERVRQRHG